MLNEKESLRLAELIFPDVTETPAEVEAKYPARELPEGAKVTRMAPSPTGFMHLGNLFGAITDERLAHQSGGVFYLRIEDTDAKREVEGGVDMIISVFKYFGLLFDEGALVEGENGLYGPYRQSSRAAIYHVFAKRLLLEGKAYPCFCTEEELSEMRTRQEELKENFGYYGKWAKWRDADFATVEKKLKNGESFVIRFRSDGDISHYLHLTDQNRGKIDLPENDQDFVLLKSDGIPTYHFAHVVDDHLMGTTHVVRGEEWLATWPIHIQLFSALGWKAPKYCHTAQLMKMDGESKRKLSKRKDPELSLDFYRKEGYPVKSVIEYLMTLLNSNFEEWRIANPAGDYRDFKFTTAKMGGSGALFDIQKLLDVSKNVISRMNADEVLSLVLEWAEKNDTELFGLLNRDMAYSRSIFAIGRECEKPRKDIAVWSEVRGYLDFFFDELFARTDAMPENISREDAIEVLERYQGIYSEKDTAEEWFAKVTELSVAMGYAAKPKEYKKNPELFKGHVGDISSVLRVAVTGRRNSPDLYSVMAVLGRERTLKRIKEACELLKNND